MKLYNSIITDTFDALKDVLFKKLDVNTNNTWTTINYNELILQKHAEFELGGSSLPAVSFSCITTTPGLLTDQILLYGKDLSEIKSDVPFGKIIFLEVTELEEADTSYNIIKDLEFIKYKLNLEGFMMRASTMDKREQVRVSKDAIKRGIDFAKIGNTYINRYKENPLVQKVSVIFITEKISTFQHFGFTARKVDDITVTMNHVLKNLKMDCHSCNLKIICDEVEGLKELHFKKDTSKKDIIEKVGVK